MHLDEIASEFIGTFFLVLTVGINVLLNTALAPISIGSMLMAMIFATGGVSGGHFNPAVTTGVFLRGRKDIEDVIAYVVAQMLGAIAAGCVYTTLLDASFTLGPGPGYTLGAAALVEAIFTAALVFVVLNVATTEQDEGNWYAGLAVGFTVVAAAFAIGSISGCSLNPAVAVGIIFSHIMNGGSVSVKILLTYVLSPLAGSVVAVFFFRVIREAEYMGPPGMDSSRWAKQIKPESSRLSAGLPMPSQTASSWNPRPKSPSKGVSTFGR
jgi:aquaporin Z